MKRSMVGTVSVLILALCAMAARTEVSSDTIMIRVQSAAVSDTVTFDVALVGLHSQSVRVATTPWQLKVPGEAPVTVVLRNMSDNEGMVVDVIRCLDIVCYEQELLASGTDEVTVVTLRDSSVAVGGLPSR